MLATEKTTRSKNSAADSDRTESEQALIDRAQNALSHCNWTVGECAAQWTQRYAKGRTDADFATLVGLSSDQIFQRRRVWETFSDVFQDYSHLKWSHFYAALTWDDAAECLQWAEELQATVAEMKAWRRTQRGEAQDFAAEEPPFDPSGSLPVGTAFVRDPSEFDPAGPSTPRFGSGEPRDEMASAARDAAGEPYAPFGNTARGAVAGDDKPPRVEPTAEQVFARLVSTVERCAAALTPEMLETFSEMPVKLQQRLVNAVNTLSSRVSGL